MRAAIAAALALIAGVLVWLLVIRDDDSDDAGASTADLSAGAGPVEATEADLTELGQRLDFPVYWAGDQGEAGLELTRTTDDSVFVRYLDESSDLGSEEPDFLTIGTYPLKDAFGLLEEAAEDRGAIVEEAPNDGLVVTNEESPTSVYIAFPDEDFQIEVYDPDPDRALDLAVSGQVEPVD